MSSILPKDTEFILPDFTLVSASAGSGKTTQLTRRLLQLLLSKRVRHNKLQNVLAITFTNNAAAEMKQRALDYLKQAAIGSESILGDLGDILALDRDELRRRAETLIDEILDNYSDFQVQTIDSFLSRVMRSSAVEFGFPPEFEIVFDNAALLDEAFDLFARDLAVDRTKRSLVEQLIETLNRQRDAEKKFVWNPYENIATEVKALYNELSSHVGMPVGEDNSFEPDGQATFNFDPADSPGSGPREGKAYEYYAPYVRAYRLLSDAMKKVQTERRIIDLSLLNKTLASRIRQLEVPEIYFALGERVHHFLIDEFQDTNPVQWTVLRPLIENSLSVEGSLFIVGDTKQAIYTFRGGDWQIMKRMMERDEFPSVKTQNKTLSENFRSDEAVLTSTKNVFHRIVPRAAGREAAELSGLSNFVQEPDARKKGRGYVGVETFPKDNSRPERERLLSIVRECVARGYALRDITILTPKNRNVIEVSSWLNEAGIPFVSHSNLDIRSRKAMGEILALLRFLDSPIDDLAFASILLGEPFRAVLEKSNTHLDVHSFLLRARRAAGSKGALYTKLREDHPEIWKQYFERLFTVVGYMPLYDLIAEVYAAFALFETFPHEEASLTKFLEVVCDFEAMGSNNLRSFLRHAEKSTDEEMWNIAVASSENAVKVMTIHKAKGLGFPVCVVLLYDAQDQRDNLAVLEVDGEIRLIRVTRELSKDDPVVAQLYERKRLLRKVDELNKLYVALTRAKKEMYVLSVKALRAKYPSEYLPENGFTEGRKETSAAERHEDRKRLVTLHPVTREFAAGREAKLNVEEVKRGEFVHAILQQLTFVGRTVRSATKKSRWGTPRGAAGSLSEELEGIMTALSPAEFNLDAIRRNITAILNDGLKQYFTEREGRTVLNEQNIVGSDGKLHRVDRLVIDADTITVIDYKTGAEDPEHHDQVRDYMKLVGTIYPKRTIQGILAYVDLNLIRNVL